MGGIAIIGVIMSKIEMKNGKLIVPDNVTIPFIEGDGVGAEITPHRMA